MKCLARVMNAIVLLNEMDNSSTIVKKVIAEALDVEYTNLFDFVDGPSVLDVTSFTKLSNYMTLFKDNYAYEETTMALKKLIYNVSTLSTTELNQHLFSFDTSKLKLDVMPDGAEAAFTRFEKLIDKLNSPSSISGEVRLFFFQFLIMLPPMYNVQKFRVFPNLYDAANTLKNISSFVVYIDKYKQLTSETNFPQLVKSVESFLPSVSIIEQLLRPVVEQLYGIHKLMSSSVKVSEKQALIGFPRGAKDMAILSKHFDDGLLKKLLNGGKSLSKLKNVLLPVSHLGSKIAVLEKVWTKPVKVKYSNLIGESLSMIRNMEKLNLSYIFNFLNNLNDTSGKFKPIDNLNNPILDKIKQHLITQQFFKKSEINELYGLGKEVEKLLLHCETVRLTLENLTETERIESIKKINLISYVPLFLSIRKKLRIFEYKTKEVSNMFLKIADFKNVLTDITLSKIFRTVETPLSFKLNIQEILNFLEFSSSLSHHLSAIDKLPEVLLVAKKQIDEWHTIKTNFKTEIEKNEDYRRLKTFPYARELTFQLVYSQQTLSFYQRQDLQQTVRTFLKNGMALADKMRNSSILEIQLAGYAWDNFFLLNKSMNTFIAETQEISSKLLIKEQNLESLADAVSNLDNINLPPLNLELMVSSLDRLKSSSLELSLEVAALKQSIKSLEGLEYAFMRKQGALPKLIARAASFFKSFFSKQPEVEWSPLCLVFIFSVIIISVLVLLILWIRSIKTIGCII